LKELKINIKYFLFTVLLLLSAGCETEVNNVKLPEFKQKLVLSSFISPSDTMSYFYVSTNRKIYGELYTEEPIGKLSGFISDGSTEIALDTAVKGLKISNRDLRIKYGTTYTVRISSEKGLSAEGSCTVPEKRDFDIALDTFSVVRIDPMGMHSQTGAKYRSIDFRVTVKDPPGMDNFYRVAGTTVAYSKNQANQEIRVSESYLTFDQEYNTDKGLDGKSISFSTIGGYGWFFNTPRDSTVLKIYLYHLEKSYYQYHKSLDDYDNGGNPFSEATPVFSNITGGFGVFTSYTIDSLIVKYK
jgi:hypothetical protein